MPLELIGMIGPHRETSGASVHVIGGAVDAAWIGEFARAHEASGFDRVLVGYSSTAADAFLVTQAAAAQTERLGFLIAHRPGFVAPTIAARTIATLDHLTNGRIALHVVTGGSDAEQRRDGDFLSHDERYERTDEYVNVLKRMWTCEAPFDYEGHYYRVERAFSDVKPVQRPHVPVYFGGSSDAAARVAVKHCDVWATYGEPLAGVRERINAIWTLAAEYGRKPRISASFRPIIAATEDAAWDKARAILGNIQAQGSGAAGAARAQSVGARRLREFAAEARVHDTRLWMAVAEAVGGAGNTACLVGTPRQVAEALAAYYDIGVTTLLIRGFDPLNDAVEYGRELIPALREEIARRDLKPSPNPLPAQREGLMPS
jgi:alkanesulfonate monooxygenase